MTDPILPEPVHYWQTEVAGRAVPLMAPLFTADQMRAYAAAARAQALEDAAGDLAQALCDDCENGVKWLNEAAAEKFKTDYPSLHAALRAMKDKT